MPSGDGRSREAQWDRRSAGQDWRDRLEKEVKDLRDDVDGFLRIKEQFIGGTKVVVGFVAIVTGGFGFVYVVIQILKAMVHGL